jgi:hypothetical protein
MKLKVLAIFGLALVVGSCAQIFANGGGGGNICTSNGCASIEDDDCDAAGAGSCIPVNESYNCSCIKAAAGAPNKCYCKGVVNPIGQN